MRPLSALPRPFLTWAGSKRLLVPHILKVFPQRYGRYFEPFLGGGALFFLLRPPRAVLGDTCAPLIRTYKAVAGNPDAVWRYLKPLRPCRDTYYSVRERPSGGIYKAAAQFIYLNKTCWNGLYRVNASGEFNVPFGRPRPNAEIASRDNLIACGAELSKPGVTLSAADFAASLDAVERGDLVYLDPPYVTGHSNNGFIDYNEVLFSWDDQCRLAEVAVQLQQKGAHVVVSNADHPAIRKLYRGFRIFSFDRKATISGATSNRGRSLEIVATTN